MLNVLVKPHRTSLMAGTGDTQKLFAMLKIMPASEVVHSRPPLAVALVIDTSGSMREFVDQEQAQSQIQLWGLQPQYMDHGDGECPAFQLQLPTKLDMAIDAAHKLVDDSRLLATDKVTVIRFDTQASTLVPLSPLSERATIHQAIDSLRDYSGETFMAKGMVCAQQQLADLPDETAKRVVLLTDGATKQVGECRRLAGVFAEANTPIIAVGIGTEYNENLMLELAQISQGRPYHLEHMGQLGDILDREVGSCVREVITDLQANVAQVKGVRLTSFTRVFPSLSEISLDSQPFRLGNIVAGDYTIFILEFTVEGLARPVSRVRVAQISLAGSAPGLAKREEFPPQDLFVTFTRDEAAVAAVDPEVLGYVQQKNVDNLVQKAMGQATVDAGQAKQTLQLALRMTQQLGNSAMTKILSNALDELQRTGTISAGTRKTVALGGRTKTIKAADGLPGAGVPSEEAIRNITGL